jgi:transcriptional regulator with XRE-family HTH domain
MSKTTTKTGTKSKPMKVVGRKYATVADLVRDTSEADFADEFDKHQSERNLIRALTVLRCVKGLSQAELAERMNCGQPKISKLESSTDADLNLGDTLSYASAMQQTVRISLTPDRATGVDHVRFYAACIKHELDRLVKIAGDDKEIGDGVEAFAIETVQRMLAMIEESISKLPHRVQQPTSSICVEVEGERGERLPLDQPKRRRKSQKEVAPVS